MTEKNRTGLEIAVIGMAGRFPGARDLEEFWQNLKKGVESINFFSDRELIEAGVDPELLDNPAYVKAKPLLQDIDCFDAAFFGYSPREAEIMDPQVRILHECAWSALEDAGYDPFVFPGLIGLYAGASANYSWLAAGLLSGAGDDSSLFEARQLFDKDLLATRIAHRLNLRGPAVSIFTSCSTSLVAVHMACQGLLGGECDMALSGGVTISNARKEGYVYQEGMIFSPDGHCRAFDSRARGTVFGDGVGVVLLKRLQDAEAAGNHIYAVIKGSFINNDGIGRAAYSAPTIEGQAAVIKTAQKIAEVEPESITYVEAHGTGTVLGDPIEIEALKLAFNTGKRNYCALGSVKSNVGHLNIAAGIAGFIKTVLALAHRQIPPSLFFESPNPKIDFKNSPFYVVTELTEWKNDTLSADHAAVLLRAGVSSFGIGGTNAQVLLEEFPDRTKSSEVFAGVQGAVFSKSAPCPPEARKQLLVLSAKSQPALEKMSENLAAFLKENPAVNLKDAAYTLQVGRKAFAHRRMVLCTSNAEAAAAFAQPGSGRAQSAVVKQNNNPMVFMFPGQGSQYVNMGRELYEKEPVFREEMDRCFAILQEWGLDLKAILYPASGGQGGFFEKSPPLTPQKTSVEPLRGRGTPAPGAYMSYRSYKSYKPNPALIDQTEITQPLLFAFEYALAKWLIARGFQPAALIGHSSGEYTAACLSGVFSLEDALELVVLRGQLMQAAPPGAMLSVPLPEKELQPLLQEYGELTLAAVNSPVNCVVSGPAQAVAALEKALTEKEIETRHLHTSHAFHSKMMTQAVKKFAAEVGRVKRNPPALPFISNVSGAWISAAEAVDPDYWADHLLRTVRLSAGLKTLASSHRIFIEVGPGSALSTFFRHHEDIKKDRFALDLVRHPKKEVSDVSFLLEKIGRLWLYGAEPAWEYFYAGEKRQRIPLPTYPFEKKRFSSEGNFDKMAGFMQDIFRPAKKADMSDWFYAPSWKRAPLPPNPREKDSASVQCLIFAPPKGPGSRLALEQKKTARYLDITLVKPGRSFKKKKNNVYIINPARESDYDSLFMNLRQSQRFPGIILHLWSLGKIAGSPVSARRIEKIKQAGYYSLLHAAQAVGRLGIKNNIRLYAVSGNMQEVTGGDLLCPGQALMLGPVKVIPMEYPHIECVSIDVDTRRPRSTTYSRWARQLLLEINSRPEPLPLAYRGDFRWVQDFAPLRLEENRENTAAGECPQPKRGSEITSSFLENLREKTRFSQIGSTTLPGEGGVYLLSGGFGGIGLALSEQLIKHSQAKLVLVGRSPFPPREEWQDRLSSKETGEELRSKLQKLIALDPDGSRIMVCSADAADYKQMKAVLRLAKARSGRVNGVLHLAGLPDGEMIQRRSRGKSEIIFAPKVSGTLTLARVFEQTASAPGEGPDFFVLFSSTAAILGGMGQVAYTAANAFMDAFAAWKARRDGGFTVSINWEGWKSLGMLAITEKLRRDVWGDSAASGLTPEQGYRALLRILSGAPAQIAVRREDLAEILKRNAAGPGSPYLEDMEESAPDQAPGQRPELTTAYVPPGNDLEKTLVDIFQGFFGIEPVGVFDDFFELGGDSLKAVAVIARIRKKGLPAGLNDLLAHPTVRSLAAALGAATPAYNEDRTTPGQSEDFHSPTGFAPDNLERLNNSSSAKNIFIIHPRHGMVSQYRELALLLEKDYNVYGVQARGVAPGSELTANPAEMASDYINCIRALQKEGPYIIAGYCVGNMIAYDLAGRLERMNHRVEKLILIDCEAFIPAYAVYLLRLIEYLPAFVKKTIHALNEKKFLRTAQRQDQLSGIKKQENHAETCSFTESGITKSYMEDRIDLLSRYIIPTGIINAPVLVPRAKESAARFPAPASYFEKLTWGTVQVIEIPGDHDSILAQPYAADLAKTITGDKNENP